MADTQQQLTNSGQEVILGDFNAVAIDAARSEDFVFAEALRLAPYSGSTYAKAIMPYALPDGIVASSTSFGMVQPNGSSGQVLVMPFRAIVGSRSAISAPSPAPVAGQSSPVAVANWRDIRSVLYVPTDDNVSLGHAVAIGANAAGNPRLDLVYAQVTLDVAGPLVSRLVKPALAGASAVATPCATTKLQLCTIQVVQGTAGASPAPPALPSDTPGSNVFNIPLAYVVVPNGFGSTSLVHTYQIQLVAPVVAAHSRVMGGSRRRPAQCVSTAFANGNATDLGNWAASGKPSWPIPSTAVGSEEIFLGVDTSPSIGTTSLPDTSVVDASIDWRYRTFEWTMQYALPSGGTELSYAHGAVGTATNRIPGANTGSGSPIVRGAGQSFQIDDTNAVTLNLGSSRSGAVAMAATPTNAPLFTTPAAFGLYVDMTTGALRAYNALSAGNFGGKLFITLRASAQFDNPG